MTRPKPLVPFALEFTERLREVALARGTVKQQLAKDLRLAMTDALKLPYWEAPDVEAAAVALAWHKLRLDLKSISEGRPGADEKLIDDFGYRVLQSHDAVRVARDVREYVELDFENNSTKDNLLAVEKANADLQLLRGEQIASARAILTGPEPVSTMLAKTHEWTSEWHENALDFVVGSEPELGVQNEGASIA